MPHYLRGINTHGKSTYPYRSPGLHPETQQTKHGPPLKLSLSCWHPEIPHRWKASRIALYLGQNLIKVLPTLPKCYNSFMHLPALPPQTILQKMISHLHNYVSSHTISLHRHFFLFLGIKVKFLRKTFKGSV